MERKKSQVAPKGKYNQWESRASPGTGGVMSMSLYNNDLVITAIVDGLDTLQYRIQGG